MNVYGFKPARICCLALALASMPGSPVVYAAVHSDNQMLMGATITSPKLHARKQAWSAAADTIDSGYFKLQAEPCLPLGPAQQTVMRIAGSHPQLDTAEAAMLSDSWRQIQHYRAKTESPRRRPQCYYFPW